MAYFAVIKGKIVDGIAIADAPLETDGTWIDVTNENPMPHPGWIYVDGKFDTTEIKNAPPILYFNKLEMIKRFTNAEYIGIISASKNDASVQAWYDIFQCTEGFNLYDQTIIDSINFLVEKNLLTQTRATEILTKSS